MRKRLLPRFSTKWRYSGVASASAAWSASGCEDMAILRKARLISEGEAEALTPSTSHGDCTIFHVPRRRRPMLSGGARLSGPRCTFRSATSTFAELTRLLNFSLHHIHNLNLKICLLRSDGLSTFTFCDHGGLLKTMEDCVGCGVPRTFTRTLIDVHYAANFAWLCRCRVSCQRMCVRTIWHPHWQVLDYKGGFVEARQLPHRRPRARCNQDVGGRRAQDCGSRF